MHPFDLKSYLKRSPEFGKECLIKTEADHPIVYWSGHSWEGGDSKVET